MQMPSPTFKQSVSPTSTRHAIRSKPLSSKHVSRGRSRSRSRSSSRPLPSVNLHPCGINDESSNSPYYKGLTDQSLAILDDTAAASCTAAPPPQHPHTPCYPISIAASTNLHLPSGHSPYYKGLTDYSLVIGSWSPALQSNPATATATATATNSLSHQSSPYYRGLLTDYSLVLHGHGPQQPPLAPHGIPHSSILSMNLTAPAPAPSPPTLNQLITRTGDDVDHDHDVGFVTEKKPLGERVSEESTVGSALQEISEKTGLVTKGASDDVGLVIEEKPLKETKTVSEASMVDSVLEENADKTTLMEMESMTKGVDDDDDDDDDNDDVELMIEEMPLRETVSEETKVESALVEENADKTILEEMELVIEEKPLRERVSETSNVESVLEKHAETTSLKEMDVENNKPSSFSEQTVKSDLPCKLGGRVKSEGNAVEEGNVYEYIWATKYQPVTLEDFICNKDKALQLKALVKEGCGCNHFIFEGPLNVGKRSMIRAMLREVFGAEKVQVITECKDFNLKGEMVDKLQVQIRKSLHHVEVNLSETQGYEKHVIVDLFKETYGRIVNNSLPCSPENCQAIVLYEAEKLSIESLLYIKWLLEKYKGCNKVFFCCSDESKLQPVKPLCTTVRLSPPSTEEILKILEYIGEKEGIKLSRGLVKKIILRSKNNLRQAIRSLEATCRDKDAIRDDDLVLTGWEYDILNISKNILEEQSPRQLYLIRRELQSLMIHDVSPDFVYKLLVAELTTLVDASLRSGVAKIDREYNKAREIEFETLKQLGHGQNKQGDSDERNSEPAKKNALSYLKVEEFIAKFMSWYKNSTGKSNRHAQLAAGT